METVWVKSKFSIEELNKKRVAFSIPVKGSTVTGLGEFWVKRNPEGLLSIEITVTLPAGQDERVIHRYQLPQAGADSIVKHPDQQAADFQLIQS